ncbi:MAG: ATPase, T2SS/T4P/T4SS family [Burkholderiales bacterium]
MLLIAVEGPGLAPRTLRVEASPCRIGRARDCEVVLPSWRVGRVHATVHVAGRVSRLVDGGTLAGTVVNGERIVEFGPLSAADVVEIAGFRLRIQLERDETPAGPADVPSGVRETVAWRRLVHRQLLQTIDLRRRDLRGIDPAALRAEIGTLVEQLLDESIRLPEDIDRDRLVVDVLDEAIGLGPLERLLDDASISEIMVNASDEIWVERGGRLQRHEAAFSDDDAVRSVIDRIVAPLGRRIDEASPMVDARLPDGSRVNAIIPPLAIRGPAVTIRRFNRSLLNPEDLVAVGTASPAMLAFLRVCVERRRNVVISGGTGSGKTTLLNVLSNLIPEGERVVTIEDAAELTLRHAHLVQLEGRPPNLEQRGEVTIRDLVRNALRMRPDRIVVGECRGGEALDMLQAMNTGHDGSLTTVHANSPRDVVSRLEVMTLMAGMDLPVQAIREQIAAAVDVIVHQARFADGCRRIVSIMEVTGIEAGRVQMQPLFEFRARDGGRDGRVSGEFTGCDAVPTFYDALRGAGVELDLAPFARTSR